MSSFHHKISPRHRHHMALVDHFLDRSYAFLAAANAEGKDRDKAQWLAAARGQERGAHTAAWECTPAVFENLAGCLDDQRNQRLLNLSILLRRAEVELG